MYRQILIPLTNLSLPFKLYFSFSNMVMSLPSSARKLVNITEQSSKYNHLLIPDPSNVCLHVYCTVFRCRYLSGFLAMNDYNFRYKHAHTHTLAALLIFSL